MGRSLVQRNPIDCGVSLYVIQKPQEWGGPGPLWAAAPENKLAQILAWSSTYRLAYGLGVISAASICPLEAELLVKQRETGRTNIGREAVR